MLVSTAVVVAADKAKMGARYWHFNVNQLGQEDIEAQLEFIHSRKCDELPRHLAQAAHAADAQHRRTRIKCETSSPAHFARPWTHLYAPVCVALKGDEALHLWTVCVTAALQHGVLPALACVHSPGLL